MLTVFSTSMIVVSVLFFVELCFGTVTKTFKRLGSFSANRRVKKAEEAVATATAAFKVAKSPATFEQLEAAEERLVQTKFLRDITS
jgi:uncharacterized protein HemY